MKILKFNEKKEELDGISAFDVESLEPKKDDLLGFVSDYKEVKDGEVKKIKKEIEVTTPGLKKSIKKFEDFEVTITIDEVESEEDVFNPSKIVMCDINTNSDECCSDCQCDPCECKEETGNIIPFGEFK